ncbi:HAMP domain-containing histidine kinase [Candidatus Parcubacteria bacterium]|nr:HAMP domain-containing histidine kinase [Candidatus Parcubacteria bacterium]
MINIDLIENIIIVLINLIGLWMVFWVLSANKKEKLNQWFAVMTFFLVLWVDFAFLGYKTDQTFLATFFYKLNWGSVALFLISSYYFYVLYFLKEKGKHPIIEKSILLFGIFLAFLSISTNFIIKTSVIQPWGAEIIFGFGNNLFNIYALFITVMIIGLSFKKYFQFSGVQKLKIQYFLIGIFVFVLFNIIFNIIIPSRTGTVEYQRFGDYSAIIFLGFTAYAIVRHKLFDIKVVLTSLFVVLIAILLLLDLFLLTTEPSYQLFKGLIFFIFLYFGFMLIRSVRGEVKRREEAEILSQAKSEFISMASHQLRTPLTAIKGYTSMMLEESYGKIEPRGKRVLSNVLISSDRLVKIVEDLLNISRIELGRMKLEKQFTDMKEMIDSIYKEMEARAKEKNLKLVWKKPKTVFPKLNIDALKIRQVIYNIVDNAIKYTKTGKIKIELQKQGSNLLITISDTGRGFSEKDRNKLFELFSRGDAGTNIFVEGTGMGLFVARKFITLHQGRIWAESKGKDKGSAFFIELPIKSIQ